jgi:hypothetical protein
LTPLAAHDQVLPRISAALKFRGSRFEMPGYETFS